MGTDVARKLAKSLKAHKREGAATSGSAKKARVEETDPTVLRLDRPEPALIVHLRPRVLFDPTEGRVEGGLEEEVRYLKQSSMMAGTESSKSDEVELP